MPKQLLTAKVLMMIFLGMYFSSMTSSVCSNKTNFSGIALSLFFQGTGECAEEYKDSLKNVAASVASTWEKSQWVAISFHGAWYPGVIEEV